MTTCTRSKRLRRSKHTTRTRLTMGLRSKYRRCDNDITPHKLYLQLITWAIRGATGWSTLGGRARQLLCMTFSYWPFPFPTKKCQKTTFVCFKFACSRHLQMKTECLNATPLKSQHITIKSGHTLVLKKDCGFYLLSSHGFRVSLGVSLLTTGRARWGGFSDQQLLPVHAGLDALFYRRKLGSHPFPKPHRLEKENTDCLEAFKEENTLLLNVCSPWPIFKTITIIISEFFYCTVKEKKRWNKGIFCEKLKKGLSPSLQWLTITFRSHLWEKHQRKFIDFTFFSTVLNVSKTFSKE